MKKTGRPEAGLPGKDTFKGEINHAAGGSSGPRPFGSSRQEEHYGKLLQVSFRNCNGFLPCAPVAGEGLSEGKGERLRRFPRPAAVRLPWPGFRPAW